MTLDKDARNRERHQVLKAMLEERRRLIHDKLRTLRETLPAETREVTDTEEQSVNDFVRDVELALIEPVEGGERGKEPGDVHRPGLCARSSGRSLAVD